MKQLVEVGRRVQLAKEAAEAARGIAAAKGSDIGLAQWESLLFYMRELGYPPERAARMVRDAGGVPPL